MNKTWIFAAMALALGTSCSKDKGIDIDDSSRQEILLGTGSTINVSPASRGYGAVGGVTGANSWNGETVYVYGITDNDVPINGVKAVAPKPDESSGANIETGMLTWADAGTHFYYEGNDKYNFYAVHVDDAADAAIDAADGTTADLTVKDLTSLATAGYSVKVKIDGTQDLMVAMPDKKADIKDNAEVKDIDNLYSAWSSRRGVVPNLVFDHLLCRLNFLAKCGNKDDQIPSGDEALMITNITVKQVVNKGDIVVIPAAKQEPDAEVTPEDQKFIASTDEGDKGDFSVKQKGTGSTLEVLKPVSLTKDEKEIGEDVLVPPSTAFKISVTASQTVNGKVETKTQEFDLLAGNVQGPDGSALTEFKKGEIYNITIKLYKEEEIIIKCTLTPWKDGGSGELDEETINAFDN